MILGICKWCLKTCRVLTNLVVLAWRIGYGLHGNKWLTVIGWITIVMSLDGHSITRHVNGRSFYTRHVNGWPFRSRLEDVSSRHRGAHMGALWDVDVCQLLEKAWGAVSEFYIRGNTTLQHQRWRMRWRPVGRCVTIMRQKMSWTSEGLLIS